MPPTQKAAWINLILQLTPIIIKIVKPNLEPLANQLAQSMSGAEDSLGDNAGVAKLKRVLNDVKPNVEQMDSATMNDVKKIVSATVATVNIIHDARKSMKK